MCTEHSYEGEEQSGVEFVRQRFLFWIFVSNVSKNMMVGSVIVSYSFSFIPPFSPLVFINLWLLPNNNYFVSLLIQVLREMNKALKHFSVSEFSVLPINRFVSKISKVHIHPRTFHLTCEIFPLPSLQGTHRYLCCVYSVSCATMPRFVSGFLKQNCDAYNNTVTFTAHSASSPKTPSGGCQLPMIFLKERGAERNPIES